MKALVKNELRLTRKLLLIWMGIVLILCGFAYFEYLSLKESLNELTGANIEFSENSESYVWSVSGDLDFCFGLVWLYVLLGHDANQQLCGLSRCFVCSERTGAGNGRISIYKTSGSQQGCLCQKQLPVYVICLHLRYSAGYVIILPPFYR